jgi:hypothetical protein
MIFSILFMDSQVARYDARWSAETEEPRGFAELGCVLRHNRWGRPKANLRVAKPAAAGRGNLADPGGIT